MSVVRIAPSILSADFAHLADEIAMLEAGGADWVHVDVMDGRFVPNITYGYKVIETVRRLTEMPMDVHLMVVEPERYFEDFVDAGATGITVHAEVSPHLQRQLARIRELGAAAGVALNPSTSLTAVENVLDDMDLLLVMTVNPGFGGQQFIPEMRPKIAAARALLDQRGARAELEVDGGIHHDNAAEVVRLGARVVVAGSAIFVGGEGIHANTAALRAQLDAALS